MLMFWLSLGNKCMKTLDIFGQPITFNIDGKFSYKSQMGGMSTILMIVMLTFMFKSQIVSFANREKLTCHIEQQYQTQATSIQMTQDNFFFAIKINQPDWIPFNERPFFMVSVNQNINDDSVRQQLMLQPCSLARVLKFKLANKNSLRGLYNQLELGSFLCPPDEFKLDLNGSSVDKEYKYASIVVSECKNSTQNNWNYTCAPQELVDKYLSEMGSHKITIYTSNYIVNPQTQNEYYQLYMAQDLQFEIQPGKIQQKVKVFHQTYSIYTDVSLFIDDQGERLDLITRETGSASMISSTITSMTPQTKAEPLIVQFTSGYYQQVAFRRFQKIDELFSYFGGIFNILVIIFGIFLRVYNSTYFKLYLANKLYQFQDISTTMKRKLEAQLDLPRDILVHASESQRNQLLKSSDKRKERKKEMKKLTLKDVLNKQKLETFDFKNKLDYLLWFFHRTIGRHRKLRFNFSYLMYKLSCEKWNRNSYNRLIDKAIEQIEDDLNVKHLVKQMIQVEKIKQLMMSRPQLQLFNYFHKPKITSHEHHHKQSNNSHPQANEHLETGENQGEDEKHDLGQALDSKKFKRLVDAYKYVQDDMTLQNKKLLFYLGPELRKIIKIYLLIEKYEHVVLKGRKQRVDNIDDDLNQDEKDVEVIEQFYKTVQYTSGNNSRQDKQPSHIISFEDL